MLKSCKPGSIVEQIYKALCEGIMDGSLAPGQSLREQELQEHFGVSRAPIREAIRLLEADRLVVVSAYKNKHVRKITREDLLETIPVLARLEGGAAFLTLPRIGPAQLEEFQQINEELKRSYRVKDITACIEQNFNFHRFYVRACENQTLRQAIRPMMKRVIGLWVSCLYNQTPELFKTTIAEHDQVLKAFAKGDAAAAETSVRKHIESLLARVLKASVFDEEGNFQILSQ
ncbi:MAG: GntR family transcriptional regulator [Deltaproteobacteria bacterium]|nr:GntR family transcriptional regulator [Deltaproteobacteria bacterium]